MQASPVLHMLPGLFLECQAGCARLCSLVGISQVSRIVTAIGDTEQTSFFVFFFCFFFFLFCFFFFFSFFLFKAAGARCGLVYTHKNSAGSE